LSTSEHDVIGVSDLSQFAVGDEIILDDHATSLTVTATGVSEQSLLTGETETVHTIAAKHDREDAVEHEIAESINIADGTTMELVDERGCPVRLFHPEIDDA
jgi:hypothetical protein